MLPGSIVMAPVERGEIAEVSFEANERLGAAEASLQLVANPDLTADFLEAVGNVHTFRIPIPASLAAGSYTLAVTITDIAGNSRSPDFPQLEVQL